MINAPTPDSSGSELEDYSDLSPSAWLETLEDIAEYAGYFEPLGEDHCVIFNDASAKLLVTFESYESITERSENGLPIGLNLAQKNGWSHLGLIAHGPHHTAPWFRINQLIGYMDRLVGDGFFEDFDQVVFYGAGPCGYAAAAFSVAAPGATVVTVAPQATLNPRLTSWDPRFEHTKRLDFTSRYGFAPDMIDAADRALVLYDPHITHDAIHASLFKRPHVSLRPCPFFGADPEFEMLEMGIISPLLTCAMDGALTERAITQILSLRKSNAGYLRRLLAELKPKGRPLQTTMLCNHALKVTKGKQFKRALKEARAILQDAAAPQSETP